MALTAAVDGRTVMMDLDLEDASAGRRLSRHRGPERQVRLYAHPTTATMSGRGQMGVRLDRLQHGHRHHRRRTPERRWLPNRLRSTVDNSPVTNAVAAAVVTAGPRCSPPAYPVPSSR